jgi:hypothetical protein
MLRSEAGGALQGAVSESIVSCMCGRFHMSMCMVMMLQYKSNLHENERSDKLRGALASATGAGVRERLGRQCPVATSAWRRPSVIVNSDST